MSSTGPTQKIITAEKGLVLDFDNVARESKAQSKEVYIWGQTEPDDLKDVTDRVAYLNFVHGSLAAGLAQKLDAARAPLKALRDAETNLQPRRTIRANLEAQLAKVENDPKKAGDLRDQIWRAEQEDSHLEKEVTLLKRKGLRESEQLKWTAIQEYAEKLLLLAQASAPILAELPTVPPTANTPYNGFQRTGAIRASLQQALDNHRPGQTSFKLPSAGADLGRSDTRSFGESHAAELSKITSMPSPPTPHPHFDVAQPAPVQAPTPAIVPSFPVPTAGHAQLAHAPQAQSPPLNPATLNQAPATLPAPVISSPSSPEAATELGQAAAPAPINPTVAETGVPLAAGAAGPGPARGSIHELKNVSTQSPGALQSPPNVQEPSPLVATPPFVAAAATQQHESAEDEKKRLAALYSSTAPAPAPPTAGGPSDGSAPAQKNETAEEEKKRLEREERERILRGQPGGNHPRKDGGPDEDLPPYQEPSDLR